MAAVDPRSILAGTLGGLLILAGMVAAPEAPLKAPDQIGREAR